MLRRVDWLIATDFSMARSAFKISLTVYKSTGRNVPEDFIIKVQFPEEGSNMFLRNIGAYIRDYTVSIRRVPYI